MLKVCYLPVLIYSGGGYSVDSGIIRSVPVISMMMLLNLKYIPMSNANTCACKFMSTLMTHISLHLNRYKWLDLYYGSCCATLSSMHNPHKQQDDDRRILN